MDNAHPNAQYIQQVYAAFGRGDMAAVDAAYADDITQHFPGRGPLAGDFAGKGAVFEWYGRVFALSNQTFWIKPQTVVADDEHAIVSYQAGAERNGQRREWAGVEVYTFREGKIADLWTIALDQYVLNEFWG